MTKLRVKLEELQRQSREKLREVNLFGVFITSSIIGSSLTQRRGGVQQHVSRIKEQRTKRTCDIRGAIWSQGCIYFLPKRGAVFLVEPQNPQNHKV